MQQHRTSRVLIAGLAALTLIATACAPTGGGGQATGTTPPDEKPVAGGRVIYGDFADIQRLNPGTSNDATSSRVSGKIYDSLIIADYQTGEIKPWLGSWTVSSDGLTFSWTIDAKANWSDGKPIIANDFLARVKMQGRSKVTPNKSVFNDVEGYQDYSTGKATSISGITIDTANPKKFTVKFTRIFCPALANVFGAAPMPEHIFGKYTVDNDPSKTVDEAAENNAPPVASGPFKFKEWRKGDQVILSRNDTYWKGVPLLDEWVQKVVADSTVLAAQLKTGEVTAGLIQPSDVADLSKADNLKLYKWANNGYTYIGWRTNNANVAFLGDKRIRQALSYGINTDEIVMAVYFGEGTKQLAHHPPAAWASAPTDTLNAYPYDKAKAEDLIKQAGYTNGSDGVYAKDGKPLAITIVTNQGNKTRET